MSWLKTLWDAMWPNMFAPSAFTLAAVAVSHLRRGVVARRRHEDLKRHVTTVAAAPKAAVPKIGRGRG